MAETCILLLCCQGKVKGFSLDQLKNFTSRQCTWNAYSSVSFLLYHWSVLPVTQRLQPISRQKITIDMRFLLYPFLWSAITLEWIDVCGTITCILNNRPSFEKNGSYTIIFTISHQKIIIDMRFIISPFLWSAITLEWIDVCGAITCILENRPIFEKKWINTKVFTF